MCEHLLPIEKELKERGIVETFRGQPWSNNCREWIYFDCYLDIKSLQERFKFPSFIKHHTNDDPRSGTEEGLYCELCKDAIVGAHTKFKTTDNKPTIG